MRIFKTKAFSKWATKEHISDMALNVAIKEIEQGLIDADLGGHIVKNGCLFAAKVKALEFVHYLLIGSKGVPFLSTGLQKTNDLISQKVS